MWYKADVSGSIRGCGLVSKDEWTQVGWSQIAQYLGVLFKGLLSSFCSLQLATEGFCLG